MTATAAAQFEALRNGPIWPVIAAAVKKTQSCHDDEPADLGSVIYGLVEGVRRLP
ncbi:hypothetical protein N9769_08600 [Ascidiaceihabitans sp.]|nr:hypothetical protein [Ascidiaceihabitans sp.]